MAKLLTVRPAEGRRVTLGVGVMLFTAALACAGPLGGGLTPTPTGAPQVAPTATPAPRTAQLSELTNQVEAREAAEADWQSAVEGQHIGAGGGARTGEESRLRLDTSEGSIIRIGAHTQFELLAFSPQATEPVTRLKLEAGKLWASVSEAVGVGMFEVETPAGVATVRGSLLSVEQAVGGGRMVITCLEGACRLSNPVSGVFTDLDEGQQSEIPAAGQDPQPAQPMDQSQYEDWLNNFPEAVAVAQRLLDRLRQQATPTPAPPPPPSAGLNLSNSGLADFPQLAFDAQGSLHVVWEDERLRPLGDYFHRQMTADGQWSDPFNLTEGFAYLYGSLSLLPYPDGRMCVLWNGAQTGTPDIGLYRRCRDADWGPAELVMQIGGTARDFSVTLDRDGTLQALYIRSAGDIYFGDDEISDDRLSAPPVSVVDARGDLHAVWVALGDPFTVVHRHRYTVEGGRRLWLDPDELSADDDRPDALGLSLAADARGRVHVVWSGANGVYYRRWTLQSGWDNTVNVAPDGGGVHPDVAVDADGLARVVWGLFEGVYSAGQAADETWSAPSRIVTVEPRLFTQKPRIVVDAQGVSHIIWITNNDVYYVTMP